MLHRFGEQAEGATPAFLLQCMSFLPAHSGGSLPWIKMSANDGEADSRQCLLRPKRSHVNLLSHFECVIDLDAKVARGAFDLGMAEQS